MAERPPSPLIDVDELAVRLRRGDVRVADTRWKLGDPGFGRTIFEEGHIPSATHLDMDRDLAAPPGAGGRHPLPRPDAFARTMSQAGIGNTLVVAYDQGDGLGAGRLWWLLRHFGYPNVVVLDGGFQAWRDADQPIEQGPPRQVPAVPFTARPNDHDAIEADELRLALSTGSVHLLDARAPERWRGDIEPVDGVPGRIPGAINVPAASQINRGKFRTPAELLASFEGLGVLDGKPIVVSCGSGVSACVDLIGLELAGVKDAKLYPGSYSGWIEKGFPVEHGEPFAEEEEG